MVISLLAVASIYNLSSTQYVFATPDPNAVIPGSVPTGKSCPLGYVFDSHPLRMGCVSATPPDSNMGATEDQQGAENQQGVDKGSTCPGGYLFVPELGSCMPAACQGGECFPPGSEEDQQGAGQQQVDEEIEEVDEEEVEQVDEETELEENDNEINSE